MNARPVVCDFCSTPLTSSGWEFPCRDFDYQGGPRVGPSYQEPIDGSRGSWLACEKCTRLIRAGRRDQVVDRSATLFMRRHPDWTVMGRDALIASIRELHDQFWAQREGPPRLLTVLELAQVAAEPSTIRRDRA